jgi:hypothetical protein
VRKLRAQRFKDDDEAIQLGQEVFGIFDEDRSGCLQSDELQLASYILQDSPLEGAGTASVLWNTGPLDQNHDGEVSVDEWNEFMDSIYQVLGKKQFTKVLGSWLEAAKVKYSQESSPKTARRTAPQGTDGDTTRKWGDASPTTPEAGQDDADLMKAATKIQAMRRGRKARKYVMDKKASLKDIAEDAYHDMMLTTVGDLWDLLTTVGGQFGRYCDVGDICELYQEAQDTGLDSLLVATAPVTDQDGTPGAREVNDILPEQVCRMCELLIDGKEHTEDEVKNQIGAVRMDCDLNPRKGHYFVPPRLRDAKLDNKSFRKLIPMLAKAMLLDKQILVSHLAWVKTKIFEAPPSLLAQVMQQCANLNKNRLPIEEAYRSVPDFTVLNTTYTLNDHVKLGFNGKLVRDAHRRGIVPNEFQKLFLTLCKNMRSKLAARTEKRKELHPYTSSKNTDIPKSGKGAKDDGFTGAEAFEVLLEELYNLTPARKYASPLAMLVSMVREATEDPLVNEDTIAANAAVELERLKSRSLGQPQLPAARSSSANLAPTAARNLSSTSSVSLRG